MRTVKSFKFRRSDSSDYRIIHRWEIVITGWKKTFILPVLAGESDNISVFHESSVADKYIYILAINGRYGYAGLEVYKVVGDELQLDGEIFWQSEDSFCDALGIDNPEKAIDKFFNYTPMTQAKILDRYITGG